MKKLILFYCIIFCGVQKINANSEFKKTEFCTELSLVVEINIDTLCKYDTLRILLTFKNNSDKPVFFYQDAPLFLINSNLKIVFGKQDAVLCLESNSDINNVILLKAGQSFQKHLIISVSNNFFTLGVNKFFILYKIPRNKFIRVKHFYGKIVSNEIEFNMLTCYP